MSEGYVALRRTFNGPGTRVHIQGLGGGYLHLYIVEYVDIDHGQADVVNINEQDSHSHTNIRIMIGTNSTAILKKYQTSEQLCIPNLWVANGEEVWVAVSTLSTPLLAYGVVTKTPQLFQN